MEARVGNNMSERASEEFRRKYPNLTGEWGGAGTIEVQAVRTDVKEAEKATHANQGYEPTAVDFIRRCGTEQQALEVINFLEGQNKIGKSYAKRLRNQLTRKGLRSFGPKRNPGCYEQD